MASNLQIVLTIIGAMCSLLALGWQARELWEVAKDVENNKKVVEHEKSA
jgi:hypothetical protein